MANKEQLVIYKGKDGKIELQVQLADDTIWLTRESIAQLFNVDRSGVSRHIKNVLADSEVEKKSNVQKMHIANSDKPVEFFKTGDNSQFCKSLQYNGFHELHETGRCPLFFKGVFNAKILVFYEGAIDPPKLFSKIDKIDERVQ